MQAEFEFLVQFIKRATFDLEVSRDQLRALWTAYCLHYHLVADTYQYDIAMLDLWGAVSETEGDTADWSDLDNFDDFM